MKKETKDKLKELSEHLGVDILKALLIKVILKLFNL